MSSPNISGDSPRGEYVPPVGGNIFKKPPGRIQLSYAGRDKAVVSVAVNDFKSSIKSEAISNLGLIEKFCRFIGMGRIGVLKVTSGDANQTETLYYRVNLNSLKKRFKLNKEERQELDLILKGDGDITDFVNKKLNQPVLKRVAIEKGHIVLNDFLNKPTKIKLTPSKDFKSDNFRKGQFVAPNTLVAITERGDIEVLDLKTKKAKYSLPSTTASKLGDANVKCSDSYIVRMKSNSHLKGTEFEVFNLEDGKLIKTVKAPFTGDFTILGDKLFVAPPCCTGQSIQAYDLAKKKEKPLYTMAVSPSVLTNNPQTQGTDLRTQLLAEKNRLVYVELPRLSPTERGARITIFDLEKKKRLCEIEGTQFTASAISDGKIFAIDNEVLAIWDVNGKPISSRRIPELDYAHKIEVLDDEKLIAWRGNASFEVNYKTGQVIELFVPEKPALAEKPIRLAIQQPLVLTSTTKVSDGGVVLKNGDVLKIGENKIRLEKKFDDVEVYGDRVILTNKQGTIEIRDLLGKISWSSEGSNSSKFRVADGKICRISNNFLTSKAPKVEIFDVKTGHPYPPVTLSRYVSSLTVEGERLYTSESDATVNVYDLSEGNFGQKIKTPPPPALDFNAPTALGFDRDSTLRAAGDKLYNLTYTGQGQRVLQIFDLNSLEHLRDQELDDGVTHFMAKDNLIFMGNMGSSNSIQIWDSEGNKLDEIQTKITPSKIDISNLPHIVVSNARGQTEQVEFQNMETELIASKEDVVLTQKGERGFLQIADQPPLELRSHAHFDKIMCTKDRVILTSKDGVVEVRDRKTGKFSWASSNIDTDKLVVSEGNLLEVYGSKGNENIATLVRVIDLATGPRMRDPIVFEPHIRAITLHNEMLYAPVLMGDKAFIDVRKVDGERKALLPIQPSPVELGTVRMLGFNKDENVTVANDKLYYAMRVSNRETMVQVFDLTTQKFLHFLGTGVIEDMRSIAAAGDRVLTGHIGDSGNHFVKIWNSNGKTAAQIRTKIEPLSIDVSDPSRIVISDNRGNTETHRLGSLLA